MSGNRTVQELIRDLFAGRPLVLASGSPRRQELLRKLGLEFEVHVPSVQETPETGTPETACTRLAREKAEAAAVRYRHAAIVAADTIVEIDGIPLGKPEDPAAAKRMLRRLSGRTHRVYTGVAVLLTPEQTLACGAERTEVTFHAMREQEIAAYVASGSPMDKAGGYGIQDTGAVFVAGIRGCFYNVMGFPLARFYRLCRDELAAQLASGPAPRKRA